MYVQKYTPILLNLIKKKDMIEKNPKFKFWKGIACGQEAGYIKIIQRPRTLVIMDQFYN